MKTRARTFPVAPLLAASIAWIATDRGYAQTFTVLHHFSATGNGNTNGDGARPYRSGLVLSGNTLYGMTSYGGTNGRGVIFSVNAAGNNFTVLHTFTASQSPDYTNFDGEYPEGGLLLNAQTLYGTALNGGTNSGGYGTLFSLGTDGSGFTLLHSFGSGSDGRNPHGPLVLSGNQLHGITESGGGADQGTVFSLGTNGSQFTTLHALTNSDGVLPYAGLLVSGGTLYGTADYGGSGNNGVVFSAGTDGTNFTVLHAFSPTAGSPFTNQDGAYPQGALVLSGDTLFGTATGGGTNNQGTLYSVKTNGTGFNVLHTFTGGSDGGYPLALTLSDGVLYGTAETGGAGAGTIYAINVDGSGFATLYAFSKVDYPFSHTNVDGSDPEGALVLSGNTLYGTTEYGGAYGNGTVFSLIVQPRLDLALSGTNVILTWPTNAFGFTLQSTTNLVSPGNWITVSPDPIVLNGRNTVTNPVGGTQKFYRLRL